jgi:hypothetical protein
MMPEFIFNREEGKTGHQAAPREEAAFPYSWTRGRWQNSPAAELVAGISVRPLL